MLHTEKARIAQQTASHNEKPKKNEAPIAKKDKTIVKHVQKLAHSSDLQVIEVRQALDDVKNNST